MYTWAKFGLTRNPRQRLLTVVVTVPALVLPLAVVTRSPEHDATSVFA